MMSDKPIEGPHDAVSLTAEYISKLDREVIMLIICGPHNVPIYCSLISVGVIDYTFASMREIFKPAILANAYSIILMHNHVSGFCNPSLEDKKITEKLKKACDMLDIKFLDHIIVGNDNSETFYSIMSEKEYNMPYERIRCDPEFIKDYDELLECVAEEARYHAMHL